MIEDAVYEALQIEIKRLRGLLTECHRALVSDLRNARLCKTIVDELRKGARDH